MKGTYVAIVAIMKFKTLHKLMSKFIDRQNVLWTSQCHPRCVICICYNPHVFAPFEIFEPQRPKCLLFRRMTPGVSVTSQTMYKDDVYYRSGMDIFLESSANGAVA